MIGQYRGECKGDYAEDDAGYFCFTDALDGANERIVERTNW